MKKKLLLSLLVLGFPLVLLAEDTATSTKAAEVLPVKKVTFDTGTNTKSPFMSQEEADKIERLRIEEEKRKKDEEEAQRIAAIKALEELKRKQILCDELKRHPSRIIKEIVKLSGIMGSDEIINGKVVSKGSELVIKLKDTKKAKVQEIEECGFDINNIKVKVIKVKSSSAVLAYEGESFKVKF
ncbi:MAG: hypothetical protein J6S61_04730 [Elusimicrobiaceae bacterium]|nr:hypothetical protein [Elusimicrobiaceae bacterium]